MPSPLANLTPALQVLGEACHILPATGVAVEQFVRPDEEEVEDTLINRDEHTITAFAEMPSPNPRDIYRPAPPLPRSEESVFTYFIDGSVRTYHLGTAIEGDRSFPVHLAQAGAAVVERRADGTVHRLTSMVKLLLLVPVGSRGLSPTVWRQLQRLTGDGALEVVNVSEPDVLSGDREGPDLRYKAGAKAGYRMHLLELALIKATDGRRDDHHMVVLDGSVKFERIVETPQVVGVAKSFRRDPQFLLGGHHPERRDITAILAGLPHAYRTVAFAAYGGKVAFWYVRLREQRELDYPLMGVVKVEVPRPDGTPLPAEEVDRISRALVAERDVTPYGRDRRWHNHLYPIFLAEEAIKAQFYSQEVLIGAIHWPRPAVRR